MTKYQKCTNVTIVVVNNELCGGTSEFDGTHINCIGNLNESHQCLLVLEYHVVNDGDLKFHLTHCSTSRIWQSNCDRTTIKVTVCVYISIIGDVAISWGLHIPLVYLNIKLTLVILLRVLDTWQLLVHVVLR